MSSNIQNNAFLLGNATLMLGIFGEDSVFDLTPAEHSVGMVKNISLGEESDRVELRHGIQQFLIDSHKSNVKTTVSAEVYEYSAKNLIRSLSLNQTAVQVKRGKLTTPLAAAGTSLVYDSDPIPGEAASAITALSDIPDGATLLLQRPGSEEDYVYPVKASGATTGTGPFTTTIAALPTGLSFPVDTSVWVVNELGFASTAEQAFYCAKIAGTLANFNRPITILLPKVKVQRGFQLNFSESNYGNMPFELDPYFLAANEATGRLAEIGTNRQGIVYIG